MQDFITGFLAFFKAFGFILSNRMGKWYLVPIILWVLLVATSTFTLAGWLSPYIREWIDAWLGIEVPAAERSFWSTAREWLHNGLRVASGWLITLLLWYLFGRMMKYIILIIMSPLLAWLSEKAEKIITGKDYPFSLFQLLKDAWRGILITIRNLIIELFLMALGFAGSFFFPAAAPFITLFLFAVNCYFMGFSMYDYYAERRKMGLRQSIAFMKQNRMMVTGLGFAFNLMAWIPFADWVLAPINGTVGAVISLKDSPDFAVSETTNTNI
jgi:CysZ protein